jgi:hypothetical protein
MSADTHSMFYQRLHTLLMTAQVEGSKFDVANGKFLRCWEAVSICARAGLRLVVAIEGKPTGMESRLENCDSVVL